MWQTCRTTGPIIVPTAGDYPTICLTRPIPSARHCGWRHWGRPPFLACVRASKARASSCASRPLKSLAYLNSPSAASELTRIVKEQPVLRAFALTALASLDEAVAESCLSELLTTSGDDETRYGAFRALRARNEENPLVQGITLNDSFGLHRVAPQSTPLIHVSTNGRAEIVLFGEEPVLQAPFAFHAADFTVTASAADGYCTVSRYPDHGVPAKRQCKTLRVAEVLRTMADLGGAYPEVIELLNQADRCKCLSCRLRYDALPLGTSVYDLAKAGKGDKDLLRADLDDDPTLYANPTRPRRPPPSLNVPVPGAGE